MSWKQVRNLNAEAEELRALLQDARAEIERLREAAQEMFGVVDLAYQGDNDVFYITKAEFEEWERIVSESEEE